MTESRAAEHIKNDEIIKVRTEQDQDYQIIHFGPYEDAFPETLWKYIRVAKSDSKRLRNANK
jgi:hypothetical protein